MDRSEIEAQIAANPYDDAAYLIYSDVLQLEGDPRGQLIAIEAALLRATTSTERATLRKRRDELLLQGLDFRPPFMKLDWHLGFVRRAAIDTRLHDARTFENPAMRFLTELVFEEAQRHVPIKEHVTLVPLLRLLALGPLDGHTWTNATDVIDLDEAVPQLAQLERLYSIVPVRLTRAPALRSLELYNVDALEWLCTAELPSLERLVVHLRAPMRTADVPRVERDRVKQLLATKFPRLVELELDNALGDELFEDLAASPLLPRLRRLRAWNAGITATGARHVTRDAFGHLELLDVTDPALDDETIRMLEGVCPDVRTLSPRLRALLRR